MSSYYEQAVELAESSEPFAMSRLYVKLTEEFYDAVLKVFEPDEMSENNRKFYELFEESIQRYVGLLRKGLELAGGNQQDPDAVAFDESLRDMDLFFADADIVLDVLRDDNERPKSKKEKAAGLAEKIKEYIPDTWWGFDISWLKKLLNQLLKILPIPGT